MVWNRCRTVGFLKRPDRASFSIHGSSFGGAGLQRLHQLERNDAERRPGAVGFKAERRDAVESEAALELPMDLRVGAAANEEPWRGPGHRLVGDDGRVVEVAVAGIEQVERIVLRVR